MTVVPDVSIIIVSYNTRDMTLEAIRSARAGTKTPHEIIVVDNASTDGSAEAIAEAFPDISLMAQNENLGFARANNLAAEQAKGTFLLLLNPDTVVLDDAIDQLLAFARACPEAKIWGGRTLHGDGSLNPTNCYAHMSIWTLSCRVTGLTAIFPGSLLFNPETYGTWSRDSEREVDIVTGCFLLIKRTFWARLGGFDPDYVMFAEEADLCLRARALGARPRVTPKAQIIHFVGQSEKIRARRQVMVLKGKTTLIRRHFPPWNRPVGLMLLTLWPWTRMIATGVLARLTGAERHRDAHVTWREIWSRRGEWQPGYPRQNT